MMRGRQVAAVGVGVALVIGAGFTLITEERWVGSTDLELVFSIRGTNTGRSVEGATIRVRPEIASECCGEADAEFTLITDSGGQARRRCQGCTCFGTRSVLKDTFEVASPLWHFRVEAPGYSPTGWLHTEDSLPEVHRVDGRRSKLIIDVRLDEAHCPSRVARAPDQGR